MPTTTEARNPASNEIDSVSTMELVQIMNSQDAGVIPAVGVEADAIAAAIDAITVRMQAGGRLIYVGAGTSGRLGVLDASECPPTFGTDPARVVGVMAGGARALTSSIEDAEDDANTGSQAMADINITQHDSVVGIAASGRTPFTIGAMQAARKRGALVISLVCNAESPMTQLADIAIAPVVGPEVLTGSTRLKAGTAQKLVLNTLSTGVMIRLGKTFGNLMVDVQASNAKLRDRAERIVAEAADIDQHAAATLLTACNGEVKTAIVSALTGMEPDAARRRLAESAGRVRSAI